ncbi:SID1 transmembrane family member 1 [Hyalella azteca]|uniref:SID1 transmembrane family member 1 n=1 Tax=Hyalella azteca TaxID=294128 RepID=A0A8B7NP63_HYAAZ|nr:SID1 transmembrane family member 1 [Hyalella azteca]
MCVKEHLRKNCIILAPYFVWLIIIAGVANAVAPTAGIANQFIGAKNHGSQATASLKLDTNSSSRTNKDKEIMGVIARQAGNQLNDPSIPYLGLGLDIDISVIPGKINSMYSENITKNEEYLFEYAYNTSLLEHSALRVTVECPAATFASPVMVVVRQQRGVLSWQLPLPAPPNTAQLKDYTAASRTICPSMNFHIPMHDVSQASHDVSQRLIAVNTSQAHQSLDTTQHLSIDVSTQAQMPLHFYLITESFNDFDLQLDEPRQLVVSPATPMFLQFKFPDGINTVLVYATSESTLCAALAVQERKCPVWDLEETMGYASFYQTMSRSAAITLTRSQFPDGFYMTLLTLRSDFECAGDYASLETNRTKTFTVIVKEKINKEQMIFGILIGSFFCLLFYVICIAKCCYDHRKDALLFDRLGPLPGPETSTHRTRPRRRRPSRPRGSCLSSSAGINRHSDIANNCTDPPHHCINIHSNSSHPTTTETLNSMIVGECNVGSSKPPRDLLNNRITTNINEPSSSSSSAIGAAVPTVILSEGGNFNDLAELSREINESMTALQRDNPTLATETSAFGVIRDSDSSLNSDANQASDEEYFVDDADSAEGDTSCDNRSRGGDLSGVADTSRTETEDNLSVTAENTRTEHQNNVRGLDRGVYFPGVRNQRENPIPERKFSVESDEGNDEFEASLDDGQNRRIYGKSPASAPKARGVMKKFRIKRTLHLHELSQKRARVLRRRSYRYFTTLLSCFIFYFVPVLQLVTTYQRVLNETGNQDICYYNFLCANPLGRLSDFNHVFSNVGYPSFGLLFAGLTYWKQCRYNAQVEREPAVEKLGIPRDFGLYYTLSFSLAMVGLLSACYHVCPNRSNFQFDTSFMYVIAVLLMLKLYQQRHPDITASADSVFIVLACSILFGVIGGLFGFTWFWIMSSLTHLLACILMSAYVYYLGRWSLISTMKMVYKNGGIRFLASWSIRQVKAWRYWRELKSQFGTRVALLLTANLGNWALLLFGLIVRPRDYDTYLLGIFLLNLVVYVIFYLCMKRGYNEHLGTEVKLTLLLLLVVWVSAICVFFKRSTDWSRSPARSRDLNQECIIFNFYDWHDIWHFLSAVALFTSFYLIMIIDDDLDYTPRDLIAVF